MKRVLIIALHYPPCSGGSGHLRTMSFCRYLPAFGWEATVLTAHPRAHSASATPLQEGSIDGVEVHRSFALDARKHLSIMGKYPGWLALPDRWSSWWFGSVLKGIRIVRETRSDVIYSTYPVATAHLIGMTLSRLCKLPWIADFRDPIVYKNAQCINRDQRIRNWIERKTVERSSKILFTTEGAKADCQKRHPAVPSSRFITIANGYDEALFEKMERGLTCSERPDRDLVRLVHSGTMYPDLRNPKALLKAIAELKAENQIDRKQLEVIFRASGDDNYYLQMVQVEKIPDIVTFEPGISYKEALEEMMSADGLLLLQTAAANNQIPAKIYEYVRARRPIFAIVDRQGETARLLKDLGIESVAQYDDVNEIKGVLVQFLKNLKRNTWKGPAELSIEQCSRKYRTAELAEVLTSLL